MFWHPYAKLTAQIQLQNHPPGKKSCLSAEKIDMLRQSVLFRVACTANLLTLSCPCQERNVEIRRASIPAQGLRTLFFPPLTFLVLNVSFSKKVINNLLAYHKTLESRFHPLQLLQFFTGVSEKWFRSLLKCLQVLLLSEVYSSLYLYILLTQI